MRSRQGGFTIIETMLFLAISGLVMAIVIVGIAAGVNRERYKDAVNSYVNFWQGQYSQTTNVINNRENQNPCDGSKIVDDGSETDLGRGTSDCTVVGRIITSSADGKTVTSSSVYATVDAASLLASPGADDRASLAQAKLIGDTVTDTYQMSWGTRVVTSKAESSVVNNFSILIIRMPTSGQITTYVLKQAGKKPAEVAALGTTNADLLMCVDQAGLTAAPSMGVLLKAAAANSGGVVFSEIGSGC